MCACRALVFLDKYASASTHAQAAVKLGQLIETTTGDDGARLHPDLPRVVVSYNAYQFALCLAESDFETNRSKIQELITSALRALTRTIDVSPDIRIQCADDFDELNALCPMFFSEKISAHEVFFDVLLM